MGKRIALALLTLAAWLFLLDYKRTTPRPLDRYDPLRVAELETGMWRSYYERRRLALFGQLVTLLREQYRLTCTQAVVAAFHAARAAAIFQDSPSRAEYRRALPPLRAFYRAILHGPAERAAQRELEWWIVHRERATRGEEALIDALAQLQAEIYRMPALPFQEHARWRAAAMHLRDSHAAAPDWHAIGDALARSWQAHRMALAARSSLLQPQNPRTIRKALVVGGVPRPQKHPVL